MTTDLLRPYRGLGAITTTWGKNWNGYDSIQMSLNRRFRDGVQATLNYTRSLRTIGNTSAQLRLQHNPDGSFAVREDQEELEELLRDTGNRPHVIRANFVWDLPGIPTDSTAARSPALSINDWQLSGVFTGTSGSRYDATFSYNANGGNVNLTGSPSYAARIKVVGDPGSGCSDDQYAQFNTAAFAGPGLQQPRPRIGLQPAWVAASRSIMDLSIARNIRLGGGRQIQLRVDMFNAFNTVVYRQPRHEPASAEQPDGSDRSATAVQRGRVGQSRQAEAAKMPASARRTVREHADGADAAAVPVLETFHTGEQARSCSPVSLPPENPSPKIQFTGRDPIKPHNHRPTSGNPKFQKISP